MSMVMEAKGQFGFPQATVKKAMTFLVHAAFWNLHALTSTERLLSCD